MRKFELVPKFLTLFTLLTVSFLTVYGQESMAPAPTNGCGEGNYAGEIARFTALIEKDPSAFKLYVARGKNYAGQNDHVNALKDFNKALELNPKSDAAHMGIGGVYHHRGNLPKADAAFTKAIELNPANSGAYVTRAILRLGDRNFDQQSLADLEKAITFDAKFSEGYYVRARVLQLMGRKQEAHDDYFRAGQVLTGEIEGTIEDECKSHIYVQRGWINTALQRTPGALADYNTAIEIESNYFLARYYRGALMLGLRNYLAAVSDFDKAIELNPTHAKSYKERAIAYDKLGAKDKAADDRKKYEELKEVK